MPEIAPVRRKEALQLDAIRDHDAAQAAGLLDADPAGRRIVEFQPRFGALAPSFFLGLADGKRFALKGLEPDISSGHRIQQCACVHAPIIASRAVYYRRRTTAGGAASSNSRTVLRVTGCRRSGARSASGASTKRRSAMRGWGISRSGR